MQQIDQCVGSVWSAVNAVATGSQVAGKPTAPSRLAR